jgi:hypothetical protein
LLIVGIAAALWTASGYVGGVHARIQQDLRGRRGPVGDLTMAETGIGAGGESRRVALVTGSPIPAP